MSKTFYKFHLIFIDNQRFNNKEICEIKMHLLSEFHVKLVSPAITWIFHMNFTWIWCEIHVKFMWNISRETRFTCNSREIFHMNFTWNEFHVKFTWQFHVKFTWNKFHVKFMRNSRENFTRNSRENFTWNSRENFTWNSRETRFTWNSCEIFHVNCRWIEFHMKFTWNMHLYFTWILWVEIYSRVSISGKKIKMKKIAH